MESDQKKQRKLSNFLLQPLLQLKLGLYLIALATLFSMLVAYLLQRNFSRVYDMVLELTDAKEEVILILSNYISDALFVVAACISIYLFITIVLSIIYTHKMVGPSYAFRRHIANLEQGKYTSRVTLRKHDAFMEVAADLNRLAETLEKKHNQSNKQ